MGYNIHFGLARPDYRKKYEKIRKICQEVATQDVEMVKHAKFKKIRKKYEKIRKICQNTKKYDKILKKYEKYKKYEKI